jgi:hypothetical protein
MKHPTLKRKYGVICINCTSSQRNAVARLCHSLFGARPDLVFQSDNAEEALREVKKLCACNTPHSVYKLVVNHTMA